jgi:hypothetical protein
MSSSALAASVEVVQGQVSLNRGAGYARVSGLTKAKAGDMVMASPNGRARVAYGNGCILEVEPGTVVTVPPEASCTPALGSHSTHYIIGGLVIAGGAGAAILLSSGSKDKSASP